jgi:hypothetical protein
MKRTGRPTKPGAPSVEERVRTIADLMVELKYHSYSTAKELSEKWGISIKEIRKTACEASRLVRVPLEDREALRYQLASELETAKFRVLNNPNLLTGQVDWRAYLETIKMQAQFNGVKVEDIVSKDGVIGTPGAVTINIIKRGKDK